jgi:hypothetical protein
MTMFEIAVGLAVFGLVIILIGNISDRQHDFKSAS